LKTNNNFNRDETITYIYGGEDMFIDKYYDEYLGRVKIRGLEEDTPAGKEWQDLHRLDSWKEGFFNSLEPEQLRESVKVLSRVIQSL
jgi:hypothetical protein